MSLTKRDISKKISKNIGLTQESSAIFLNAFISLIKIQSKTKSIKISNFGTFYVKQTLKRTGRNPKTKESYIINSRKKLNFKASNILKKFLNP